ncbi:mechanosensitive ion channel protein [[Limnothrix rosea] IAM M-220]|nr:mechanosensitive ion channel protein [[Limnothrix rosea] IAM M-220]
MAAIAQPIVEPLITSETVKAETLQGAPVVLGDSELFRIEARIASFDPEFRAKVISERLLEFAKNEELNVDYLQVIDNEETKTSDVLVGTTLLATLADVDAVAAGTPRYELAKEYQNIIRDEILKYRAAFSLQNIFLGIAYTIISSIILLLCFLAINSSLPRVHRYLRHCQHTWIPAFKIFGIELLSSKRVVDLILELIKISRLTIWLTLIYIYGNLVLSFFPWTQGFARRLFGYASSAVFTFFRAGVNYLPNLFFIAVIIFVTSYTLKICRFFFREIEKGKITIQGFYPEWAIPTYKLVQFLVLAFAAIVAFPYLPGAETPAFQGISIFLGLLLSLGSTAAVANVVAGTIMTYTRAFRIGDRIQIGDTKGDVLAKTLLVTRIRTLKNEVITIPNSAVLSSHIVNYSEGINDPETPPLILHTTITLGYDVPWRKVHEVLLDAVAVTQNTLLTPKPFILQTSLDDFYVSYEINAYTDKPKLMPETYSNLHKNIQDKCNGADIEILSPHYRAARDGNQSTIPAQYLPEDYEPPNFRVTNFPPQKNE